jgi:uncharacterized protein YpbB
MSEKIMQENLEQFFKMAAQDLELQEKLKAASDDKAYISLVVELGKEKGYGFTSDQVATALETAARKAAESAVSVTQLLEQEVESVVAGGLPLHWNRKKNRIGTSTRSNPFCDAQGC